MSKIKFWPDVVAKTLDVEVETDSVRVRFTLDLEEAYETIDDLQNAILIVERSFPDILHNGVGTDMDRTNNNTHPFPGNVLMRVDKMDEYDDETRTPVTHPDDANVVSSIVHTGLDHGFAVTEKHRPVLDIDFPAALVPSTTPGHFHLYLDHAMSWADYEKFLRVCGEVGILEQGYVNVSIERRHTAVRVPWIQKGMDQLGTYAGRARKVIVDLALSALR